MLQAESRRRQQEAREQQGEPLSDAYRKWSNRLTCVLDGGGTPMVVGYDRRIGLYLTNRIDSDADIIRAPVEVEAIRTRSGLVRPLRRPSRT
jgi:hypothetical protein